MVGGGRLGSALVGALPELDGPFGRGFDGRDDGGRDYDVVILAVPDRAIGEAAASIARGRLVGHCSGATSLDVLAPHERFGMHPLMTISARGATFDGAWAAVDGSTERALATAHQLAERLGMGAVRLDDGDRAAYHAAASIASNFLVTIEDAAEQLLATARLDRSILLPLIRATIDNWERDGRSALTGPVARGDDATVARQRAAIEQRAPALLELFDAAVTATRRLA